MYVDFLCERMFECNYAYVYDITEVCKLKFDTLLAK